MYHLLNRVFTTTKIGAGYQRWKYKWKIFNENNIEGKKGSTGWISLGLFSIGKGPLFSWHIKIMLWFIF